ncbi:helix-turn-helix domain-containing protein [Tepidibacter thalassicus]|uniref:Helix-turn-helix n=1 Tax=Tepidibacter thalassicus DSM 15285 TaxID=1123350 RepID=A0A1M5PXZ3_9FIRM|nr:helix-turn-helix transcriptional regulator [Tepidibacter thalassicus]SHH06550.1 Helix-turn-helix [Tepidibacter thalassicus DSM 15285]
MKDIISNRLKFIRLSLKMSQKNFSNFLNISLRTYQSIEQGRKHPGLITIIKIANKLGVSLDWLLGRDLKYIYGTDADIIELIKFKTSNKYQNK